MADFKDMLKFFRMEKHLSQRELARKLGVSASTISMYEVGKRQPDFETEEKIADFFNVDLNTLRGKDTEAVDTFVMTDFEKILIEAYRQSDMKAAVCYLLKLKERKEGSDAD